MQRQRLLFPAPAQWTRSAWQAATIVLLALLVASNAAWLHASSSGSDMGAHPRQLPVPHRVIYEYPRPAAGSASTPMQEAYRATPLEAGERCAGGQIIRRLPNGWEGSNRPCNP